MTSFPPEDVLNFEQDINGNIKDIPGNIKRIPGKEKRKASNDKWKIILKKEREEEEEEEVYAMYRNYNRGKVLAIGHQGFLAHTREEYKAGFLLIILNFLRGINGEKKILISNGHCEHVTQNGGWDYKKVPIRKLKEWNYDIKDISGVINRDKLKKGNILIIANAWGNLKPKEIDHIEKFVSKGGKIIAIGTRWSWKEFSHRDDLRKKFVKLNECDRDKQDPSDLETYPMNKLLDKFGATFTEDKIEINAQKATTSAN